jgi:uncharacterized membrane protein
MTLWWSSLPRQTFFVLMAVGAALITLTSLVYFDPDVLAPFVIEKLPVRFETLWLVSLKAHVASALVSFPLCLLLMTRWIQRRKVWHRWIGRIAGLLVVAVLVPTGAVLSLEAKGGTPVTLGFLLSGAIVLAGMIHGVRFARQKQLVAHARAMRHVVAQMSVAVTSRAMLIAFDFAGTNPDTAYVVALWVPVLVSALAAEWASGRLLPLRMLTSHPQPRSLS